MRIKAMTLIRRGILSLVMGAMALTFSQTGQTQSACIVERGQDPLDVLNSGVRHNVWFILDTSGSMTGTIPGSPLRKWQVAEQTINDLLDEFVDAAGRPLVNWGFAWYWLNNNDGGTNDPDQCIDPNNGLGVYPDAGVPNECLGLDPNWFDPPACGASDPRQGIKAQLASLNYDGWTPNGIVALQIGRAIGANNYATLLPNQKNFIILLTDGEDTCECDSTIWPSTPAGSVQLRESDVTPALSATTYAADEDIKAANAGFKAAAGFIAMNGGTFPATEADVKGDMFVVGLGLNAQGRRRTNHIAWEGSGLRRAALFADDAASLKQRLKDALAQIGVPASEVVGTPTVVGTVKEIVPSITGPTLSNGDILADTGTPDFDDIRVARLARDSHERNVAFSTSFEAPGFRGHLRATNIYEVTDPNNPKLARAFTLNDPAAQLWDAGALLEARDPDNRTIFFNRRGNNTMVEFTVGNVSATDLGVTTGFLNQLDGMGAASPADAAEIVVRVTRGEWITVDPASGTIYNNVTGLLNFSKLNPVGNDVWKLFDITGAPVIVQEPPRSVDFDPPLNHSAEYGVGGLGTATPGFYWDHLNRQTMVYVGTNQGLFHAFRADSGAEMFAYIPDDKLGLGSNDVPGSRSTLKDIVELVMTDSNGVANHLFGLAAAMNVEDVFLQTDDEWHTVVAFGRGKGGRYVTALDVSEVGGDWSGTIDPLDVTDPLGTELPQLLFNIGNPEEINDPSDMLDGLGETWGMPAMFNVPSANAADADDWVMVVPGGYGCDNGENEGQYLFVFKMEDGSFVNRYAIDDNGVAPIRNGLITLPVGLTPHQADINDGKDWYTRIYVGDLHGQIWKLDVSSAATWVWEKLVQLSPNTFDQPIAADMSLLYDPATDHTWLFVGTGGDRRVDSVGRLFMVAAIEDVAPDGGGVTANIVWTRDLGVEERVDSRPIIFGQFADPILNPQVSFLSNRTEFFPAECRERFFGTLYLVDFISGLAVFDMDPNTGGTQDSVDLGEGKATGLFGSDNMLMVSSGNGLGQTGTTLVYTDGSGGAGGGPQDYSGRSGGTGGAGSVQVLVDSFRISPF